MLSYMLMLIAMTFNVGLFLAIILGLSTAYVTLGLRKMNPDTDEQEYKFNQLKRFSLDHSAMSSIVYVDESGTQQKGYTDSCKNKPNSM